MRCEPGEDEEEKLLARKGKEEEENLMIQLIYVCIYWAACFSVVENTKSSFFLSHPPPSRLCSRSEWHENKHHMEHFTWTMWDKKNMRMNKTEGSMDVVELLKSKCLTRFNGTPHFSTRCVSVNKHIHNGIFTFRTEFSILSHIKELLSFMICASSPGFEMENQFLMCS